MQPVPLTGTATVPDAAALPLVPDGCSPCPSRGQQPRLVLPYPCLRSDAARTPHGDSNSQNRIHFVSFLADAARIPHGDNNPAATCKNTATRMQPVPLTGTTTKYGVYHRLISFAMQPVPLTGTATVGLFLLVLGDDDAARTPHGDNNITA